MIRGIVVNKRTFKYFVKLSSEQMPEFNGIPYFPWNSVGIYVKRHLRGARICYTDEQLKELLK